MAEFSPFNEDELEHLIRVEASDQELRHKTYSQLRAKEAKLNELVAKREGLVRAPNFTGSFCALCCASFSFFSRGKLCSSCKYLVCTGCVVPNKNGLIVCSLCDDRRDVKLRQKEWSFMCPYSSVSFGIVKLFTPSHSSANTIQYPWLQRTRIEIKLQKLTNTFFDDQAVNEKSYAEKIESARKSLEKSITGLFQQNLSFADSVLTKTLQTSINEIKSVLLNLRREETNFTLSAHPIPRTYEALISTAVVNKITLSCVNWPLSVERVSSGTQTDDETESPRKKDETVRALASEHAQSHKVPLPSIDIETDIDSALDTDEVDSLSSWGPNWFLKGQLPISPHGSIRSQASSRVPLNFNSFLSPFEEDQDRRHDSTGDDASVEENENTEHINIGEAPRFLTQPENLSCSSGDLAVFGCEIVGTEPIDVYWYSSSKEISDQGKFRILNRGKNHWLQIFDVEQKDAGEIVCLAVNEVSVSSVIAVLKVKDIDLAGEEPSFQKEMNNAVAKEGETIKLSCKVSGFPIPRVLFHKNNVVIHEDENILTESNSEGIWTIQLSCIKVDQSGQYTAVAVNRMGRVVSRAAVSIFPKASNNNSPASVQYNKKSTGKPPRHNSTYAEGKSKKIHKEGRAHHQHSKGEPQRERNTSVASSSSC